LAKKNVHISHTDRRTDGQTDRQTGRRTDRKGHINILIFFKLYIYIYRESISSNNRNQDNPRAKRYYDRKLKKCEYKIGDLVLCNHPKVKKGMARGLAPKYHGPFVVVGVRVIELIASSISLISDVDSSCSRATQEVDDRCIQ
jgi:hypothetical protein